MKDFPPEERFAMAAQISNAARSFNLNMAEGCNRHSIAERKWFYEIVHAALIEVDTKVRVFQPLPKLIRG